MGHINNFIEYSLQLNNTVALIPIVEHANGIIVATENPELHQEAMQILNTER